MSKVKDSGEYDSDYRDLWLHRPMQRTLLDGNPIRKTRVNTYSLSARKWKDKGWLRVLNTQMTITPRNQK